MKRVIAACLTLMLALVPVTAAEAAGKGRSKGKTPAARSCKAVTAVASAKKRSKKAKRTTSQRRRGKACGKTSLKPVVPVAEPDFAEDGADEDELLLEEAAPEDVAPEPAEPVEPVADGDEATFELD